MSCGPFAAAFSLTLLATEGFTPARFSHGQAPLPPQQTVGWAEVFLQVSVSAAGRVQAVETLRATEPLATLLRSAVESWIFQPAMQEGRAEESEVLVAAIYRPATLFNTPSLGKPSRDLSHASEQIPFPTLAPSPSYPPRAISDGVVVVEALVARDGGVRAATVVRSSGTGFNAGAVQAAVRWRFRPARRGDVSVPAFAYLIFGFRQPVIPPPRVR